MLSYFSRQKTAANKWEHSSAGRASALQAEGHRFEPYCSHHYGLVVQLVRTLACHARGRRFDPDPGRQFASVAQSVEQGTENPRVIGSIPIGGTLYAAVAHLVERHLAKVEVASSSLVGRSNTKPSLMQKCKNDGFFVLSLLHEKSLPPWEKATLKGSHS